MKLLVLGAAGMLGRDLLPELAARYPVVGLDLPDCDISDAAAVDRTIAEVRPDWVVNCAAYTAVDRAESEPEKAQAINVDCPRFLAAACREAGCRLLHISTDYVFDGAKPTAYQPSDPLHPLSAYGRSKAEGEAAVREVLGDAALILRTAWLFGPHGPNFVSAILRQIDADLPLRVVSDQVGSPTYTVHFAQAIAAAVQTELRGVHHAVGGDHCTWFEFAAEICGQIGKSDYPLAPTTTAQINRPAPRPANSRLDTASFEQATGYRIPPWRDGLTAYLQRIGRFVSPP